MLAIKLIASQGVEVIALYIQTGFGSTKDIRDELMRRASLAGAKLLMVDVREEYIQKILFDPIYGYGKIFNPLGRVWPGILFTGGKVWWRLIPLSNSRGTLGPKTFVAKRRCLGTGPLSRGGTDC